MCASREYIYSAPCSMRAPVKVGPCCCRWWERSIKRAKCEISTRRLFDGANQSRRTFMKMPVQLARLRVRVGTCCSHYKFNPFKLDHTRTIRLCFRCSSSAASTWSTEAKAAAAAHHLSPHRFRVLHSFAVYLLMTD